MGMVKMILAETCPHRVVMGHGPPGNVYALRLLLGPRELVTNKITEH